VLAGQGHEVITIGNFNRQQRANFSFYAKHITVLEDHSLQWQATKHIGSAVNT
jgi:hypothetical protein